MTAANLPRPFNLLIDYDGTDKEYTTTVGSSTHTTAFYSGSTYIPRTMYPYLCGNVIRFIHSSISGETGNYLRVYEATQTTTKTGLVTVVSDNTLQSFGFDGPAPLATIQNGVDLIKDNDGCATIWVDVGSMTDPINSYISDLVATNHFELGIHFSQRLDSLSNEDAFALIDSEVATVTAAFGQAPMSWCSLQNGDTVAHAEYAYTEHGMIWRSGIMGINEFANMGNLDDTSWAMWSIASAGGLSVRAFTHRTDESPAIDYSIDSTYFNTFIQNFSTLGMKIVPYISWYKRSTNPGTAAITYTYPYDNSLLRFTATTNGYPCTVCIDVPYTKVYSICDQDDTSIPFTRSEDNTVLCSIPDGTYSVYTAPQQHPGGVSIKSSAVTFTMPHLRLT